jgi:MYXO-CTERM domain-containing protein
MRNILRFITLAVLALAAPASQAATITYDAFVGCNNTCVTVDLEWSSWPTPIGYVEVDDDFGDFLFGLNTPPFGETTGSILPNPQTISGLSPGTIALIENGGSTVGGLDAPDLITFADASVPTYANLCLDSSGPEDDCDAGVERFVATTSAPEPAAWSLTGAGLALLFAWRTRRRKFQTGTGATTLE